jgi:hypothetical protein
MTAVNLKAKYDQAFPTAVWIAGETGAPAATPVTTATDYCVISQNGNWYAYKHGPGGQIVVQQGTTGLCA